jgi:ureidoacrylate peracid hydrolase
VTFEADLMALLVVDPYNDFISEGGKWWPNVKEIAEAVNCVSYMRDVLHAARDGGLRVIFVPHHRWRENDIAGRKYLAPIQRCGYERRIFEAGSWGGEFHPDFRPSAGELIAQEHWCSSGFANTDLDLAQTTRHSQTDCYWSSRQHVHRFNGPVRGGTGL